jgi:hypothetical protein
MEMVNFLKLKSASKEKIIYEMEPSHYSLNRLLELQSVYTHFVTPSKSKCH